MNDLISTRYGALDIPTPADLVSRFLVKYGEWAYLETEFLRHVVPTRSRIFDVGAYLGTFSLGALTWLPERIVAIEANPAIFQKLTFNLQRNCTVPFDVVKATVGLSEEIAHRGRFTEQNNLGSLSFARSGVNSQDIEDESVETASVDTLRSLRERYGDYDFLKLDIEGSEWAALKSDRDWIIEHHPCIWLECNEENRVLQLFEFLQSAKYKTYFFSYPSFNPANFKKETEAIFPIAYEAGLLGVPMNYVINMPQKTEFADCMLAAIDSREQLKERLWLTPRWGMASWTKMTRVQLIALCSRFAKGQSYKNFLQESSDRLTKNM